MGLGTVEVAIHVFRAIPKPSGSMIRAIFHREKEPSVFQGIREVDTFKIFFNIFRV